MGVHHLRQRLHYTSLGSIALAMVAMAVTFIMESLFAKVVVDVLVVACTLLAVWSMLKLAVIFDNRRHMDIFHMSPKVAQEEVLSLLMVGRLHNWHKRSKGRPILQKKRTTKVRASV